MNPESWTKNFRGFVMSKKYKKHGYAERLKYMHMIFENKNVYLPNETGLKYHLC